MPFTYSILGATGFIGNALLNQTDHGYGYNRVNVNELSSVDHDILVIAAPSGNRIQVNQNHLADYQDCESIIEIVKQCRYNKVVHLSTVDVFKESLYGSNRKFLENELSKLHDSITIRLPSIIASNIKKNIIHDLKHNIWLDKISLDSRIQWYPLKRLRTDIETIISNQIKTANFVSQPIDNREIVGRYFNQLLPDLDRNQAVATYYDLKFNETYWVPTQEVWNNFDEYFLT
jgi:hypothetical protein